VEKKERRTKKESGYKLGTLIDGEVRKLLSLSSRPFSERRTCMDVTMGELKRKIRWKSIMFPGLGKNDLFIDPATRRQGVEEY